MSTFNNNSIDRDYRYSWQDFYQIEKESTYVLSEKVLAILAKLSEDVGIPAHASVNENSNHNGNSSGGQRYASNGGNRVNIHGNGGNGENGRNGNRNGNIRAHGQRGHKTGEEIMWDSVRKNTPSSILNKVDGGKMDKGDKSEGVEKIIQEIRIGLNKMTDKNYQKQRDEIREKIKSIAIEWETEEGVESEAEKETGKDNYKKVAKTIFEIASTNKFFSKIYAQLYLELMQEFVFFQELLDTFIEGFINKLATIQYIDPDKDYDGYCLYTKQQDERKAMTGFLIHLAVGVLEIEKKGEEMVGKLERIVLELTEKVVGLIDGENKINEVEEITEILFLFFSLGAKKLTEKWKQRGLWNDLVDKLTYMSKQKVKEHQSYSSRALFKYLDIQKLIL